MNTGELVRLTRQSAQDIGETVLWTDEEILSYLNEGQIEACRNARLLKTMSMELGEVSSTTTLTINSNFGSITSILVAGINILINTLNYTNDNSITAMYLSAEINETGLFISTVNGNVITLKPQAGNGEFYNNIIPIINSTTNGISVLPFAGGVDGVARFTLKPNKKEYKFSNKVIKFDGFYLGTNQKRLKTADFRDLNDSDKTTLNQKGIPNYILYGMSNDSFYVGQIPNTKDFINATVYYMPLKTLSRNADIPEIAEHLHSKLIHYALYKMYQKNDIEANQLDISSFHYQKFIEEFNDNQFSASSNNTPMFIFGE